VWVFPLAFDNHEEMLLTDALQRMYRATPISVGFIWLTQSDRQRVWQGSHFWMYESDVQPVVI